DALAMALDGDKIVVAGDGDNHNSFVARLTSSGTPDDSFNGSGQAVYRNGTSEEADGVVVQPDHRIVLAGRSGSQMFMRRLDSDGSPDNSFNGTGTLAIPFPTADISFARALALQPDG